MALSGSCTLRNSLVLFVMMQVVMMNTLAARPFAGSSLTLRYRRALLQTGKVLTEYIGASGSDSMQFTDVPLSSGVQYIFPLAFAIDADVEGNTANGVFSAYWDSSLTSQSALNFVQANSNVKISVSLAGASQYVNGTSQNVNWYDPNDSAAWITNAVSSITNLASQFSITGIDIDYENFPTGSTTFTACIGGLITQLKNAGTITVASIAPYSGILPEYTDLYNNYENFIDYVNYQFYAEGLTTVDQYVSEFSDVANTFPATKLMASVNVESGSDTGLQGQTFIDAVQQLTTYAGIMIWEADADKGNDFSMTNLAATQLSS